MGGMACAEWVLSFDRKVASVTQALSRRRPTSFVDIMCDTPNVDHHDRINCETLSYKELCITKCCLGIQRAGRRIECRTRLKSIERHEPQPAGCMFELKQYLL